MSIREVRREAAIDAMADHLLTEGLRGASLRGMAAAAGVSDRMLLYYFADKDEILGEVLQRIAARLAAVLDAALPPGARLAYADLLGAVWTSTSSPALQPYMLIWLDLAAAAARREEPHRMIASAIAEGFHAWIVAHLQVGPGEDPRARAALLLGTVEGFMLLDALGRRDLADAAAGLAGRD